MNKRIIILGVVLVAALAGISATVYFAANRASATTASIETSGTIEATQIAIVAEVGGQIADLPVQEGRVVAAGAVLAQIDPSSLDAQIARAQAGLDAAQANLAQVKAGSRSQAIAQAQAALARAITARDGAQQTLKDLQAVRANPQELDAQIAIARAALNTAQASVTQGENQVKAAQVTQARYKGATSWQDRASLQAADAQVDAAKAGLQGAQAGRDGAQTSLNLLLEMRQNPIQLNTQIHAAEAGLAQASAAAEGAQASLDGVKSGATQEQIAVADAQVQQAQAGLEQLQVMRAKTTFRAPIDGLVTTLSTHSGENVQPGTRLYILSDLDTVDLRLYVPEPQIGRVKLGQRVVVRVDSWPGRSFQGQVTFISPQAEFTPSGTQTKTERTQTVFRIKVRLANADHALKPGLPADAVIELD